MGRSKNDTRNVDRAHDNFNLKLKSISQLGDRVGGVIIAGGLVRRGVEASWFVVNLQASNLTMSGFGRCSGLGRGGRCFASSSMPSGAGPSPNGASEVLQDICFLVISPRDGLREAKNQKKAVLMMSQR